MVLINRNSAISARMRDYRAWGQSITTIWCLSYRLRGWTLYVQCSVILKYLSLLQPQYVLTWFIIAGCI